MQAYCVTCESLVGFRFLSNSSTRLHSRHHSANHSSHSLCPSYQKKKKKKGFVVCFNGWQKKPTEPRNKTSMMVKWFFITALFLDSKAFYTAFKCIGDSVFFVPLHRANVKLPSLLCRRAHRRFFTPPDFFVILIYL